MMEENILPLFATKGVRNLFMEIISGRIKGLKDHREFLVDDEADIKNLPTKCAPGSKAHVVNQRRVYILNTQGEWKVYIDYNPNGSPDT